MANAFKKGAFKVTAFAQAPSVGGFDSFGFDAGGYFTNNSGAAYSLAITTGSYTVTGINATFGVGEPIVSGTYSVSGNATGFRVARKTYVTTGSYTQTGFTSTASRGRTVTITTGTYNLTGNAIAFGRLINFLFGTGSITVTPYNPTLIHGYSLSNNTGSYLATGHDPDLYRTTFFYIDSQVVYVPYEIRTMFLEYEDRTLQIEAREGIEELSEDRVAVAENRIRVLQ